MGAIALLRGSALIGRDVPSLFGGTRWSVSALSSALRLRPDGGFAPLDGEQTADLTVDLPGLIEREAQAGPPPAEVKGANPAAGFLAVTREGGRNVSPGDSLGTLDEACAALATWLQALAGEPGEVVRPARWSRTESGRALDRALELAGFEIRDLEARAPRPALIVDELSLFGVGEDGRAARLAAHGQAASLAFGLAPHAARRMVELAGAERVWTEAYSPFARAVAVQSLERALLRGIQREAPFALGGESAAIFPALPDAAHMIDPKIAAELERLRAAGESTERLDRLVSLLEQKREILLEDARRLWSLEVLAGLPRLDDLDTWFEKQDELLAFLDASEPPLAWLGRWRSPVGRFLAHTGRAMRPLPPRWFRAAPPAAEARVVIEAEVPTPEASAPAPVSVPEAEPKPVEPAASPTARTSPSEVEPEPAHDALGALSASRAHDPRILQLSVAPNPQSLEIFVDGVRLADAAGEVEPLFARGGAVLRLRARDLGAGDVVCVKYLRQGDA